MNKLGETWLILGHEEKKTLEIRENLIMAKPVALLSPNGAYYDVLLQLNTPCTHLAK